MTESVGTPAALTSLLVERNLERDKKQIPGVFCIDHCGRVPGTWFSGDGIAMNCYRNSAICVGAVSEGMNANVPSDT